MREIRFRAYVIDMNKVLEVTEIDFENRSMVASDEDGVSHAASDYNFHLMQYTGLKDKNGVEIYEGDVIEYRESFRGEVIWVCDYRQQGNYLKTKDSLLNVLHPADNFVLEVIGNIYENSELLEESK